MAPARDVFGAPSNASGVVVRPLLAGGLAFLDAASVAHPGGRPGAPSGAMRASELVAWFSRWLVDPGTMPTPASVHEPGAGMVSLATVAESRSASGVLAEALETRLGRIIATARVRVGVTLGGLLASPVDDRFLSAAIFADRVQRTSGDRGTGWRATPKGTERLSDVVLSLFAADALANREEYDACLCVCGTCGRVALRPGAVDRMRCPLHEGPG